MRQLHKFYAWLAGYFWLPCPVCGEYFGGHEIASIMTEALVMPDGHAYSVCPKPECNHEAKKRNIANGMPQFVKVAR